MIIRELFALVAEIALVVLCIVVVKTLTRTTYRQAVRVAIMAMAGAYVALFSMIVYLKYQYPPITAIRIQRTIEGLFQGSAKQFRWQPAPLSQVSPNVIHAVIVGEDPDFLQHRGVDWHAVSYKLDLALRTNTKFVGASSITQQLAKNLFLPNYRSYLRKIVELSLVPLLEWILPKGRILDLYLNVVEWGDGVFGVQAAAAHYYGVPADTLSREQSARLVAALPNPRRRNPLLQHETSARILARMSSRGW